MTIWARTLLLTFAVCSSPHVLAQNSAKEVEEAQESIEIRRVEVEREVANVELEVANVEREVANVEREMRVAETQLADAARRVAELSSRQLQVVGSGNWNFDLDFDNRPVLGITIGAASEEEPVKGVAIIAVSPGGAASEAGLRSGDVITAVNKESLGAADGEEANKKLLDFLSGVEQGDVLDVTYLRAGKTATVEVSPQMMSARVFQFSGPGRELHIPVMPHAPGAPGAPGATFERFLFDKSVGGWGDLEMVELTEDLGRYFGAEEGLLVVRAPTDEKLQLRDGDVIEDIDGRKPESVSHAIRILGSYQSGEELKLKIMRDKRRQTLKIEMPDNRRSRIEEFVVPTEESRAPAAPAARVVPTAPPVAPAEEKT